MPRGNGASGAGDSFEQILERRLSRRTLLKYGLGAAAIGLFAAPALLRAPHRAPAAGGGTDATLSGDGLASAVKHVPLSHDSPLIGFKGVPPSAADTVVVPEGYRWRVLFGLGDPISANAPFDRDGLGSPLDQTRQSGDHHDGLHYFPLPYGSQSADHGLLAINHEYIDPDTLHHPQRAARNVRRVRREQAAHGVSIIEVRRYRGAWQVVRPSDYARRITAFTPTDLAGPASRSMRMRTALDPLGRQVLGTLANCAHGYTPWGTYLTCEENWAEYFVNRSGQVPREQMRYAVRTERDRYGWARFDERFDAHRHPNEPNRFGWVVEIDPYDPSARPVKRTALGRFAHEGAWPSLSPGGRLAYYMGDDARFEYSYKFVTRDRYNPRSRAANRSLLDYGTLYVARFNEDGSGEWLALEHGRNGLTARNGFPDQASVLINTRGAADKVGATRMDRPEWGAVHPHTREVFMTLTNNRRRERPNPANPRANNRFGHILRWREADDDPVSTRFEWEVFLLCGDPDQPDPALRGDINGDVFAAPDGLWVDPRGVLWIQTDVSAGNLLHGDHAVFGNNQMLAADPSSREVRRFLTGPRGCEVTGVTMTPDGKAMFVNIQHPGEGGTSRENPTALSRWPDGIHAARPRSATIVIEKDDGGVIGT